MREKNNCFRVRVTVLIPACQKSEEGKEKSKDEVDTWIWELERKIRTAEEAFSNSYD